MQSLTISMSKFLAKVSFYSLLSYSRDIKTHTEIQTNDILLALAALQGRVTHYIYIVVEETLD